MKYNSPLPAEIEECQRAFIPRKSYHFATPPLTFKELWEFMPDTVRYVGGEQDFKAMLPRFFELAWQAVEKDEFLDLFPLTSIDCEWQSWPDEQRLVIESCLTLLWCESLERKNDWNTSEILSSAHSIGLSWLPFLESWFSSSCPASVLLGVVPTTYSKRLSLQVQQWLCHPRIIARIEADFFAATDPEEASDISRVHEDLNFYCSQAKSAVSATGGILHVH